MATTNISTEIVSITGVTAHGASDDFIVSAQKFVAASIPKSLLRWAASETVPATHGGDADPQQVTIPTGTDSIISVRRDSYVAQEVGIEDRGFIASSNSLRLATNTFPKYFTADANRIIVKPDPDSTYKIYVTYVDYSNLDDDSDLRNAVIYHACSSELSKLSTAELPTVSIAAVPPDVPSLATVSFTETNALSISVTNPTAISLTSVTFTSLDSDIDASLPTYTTAVVVAGGVYGSSTSPAYTKPTLTTPVSFEDFFSGTEDLNPFGDADPGVLTIASAAPAISISGGSVAAITIAALPTAPSYTPPAVGGATESLTAAMDADSSGYGTEADFLNYSKWFSVLSEFIEDEEDSELASAQIQKINSYIGTYQAALQDSLNTFNEANVVYQAGLQKNLQQAQINTQDVQKEADMALQAAIQDASLELQKYQAGVNSEVQQYTQRLSRYQLEVNTAFQAWQKTESDRLSQYQTDIQSEVNEFNKENVLFQANMQEALQEIQVANQVNIAKAQGELQLNMDNENRSQQRQLQNGINDMQAIVADNQRKITQYQAEASHYATQVNQYIQNYTSRLQKDTQDTQAAIANNDDLVAKYQSELQQYTSEVQAETAEYQNKIQKQQAYSKEADKYYQWANLEVKTYIQNNSKMIAATMSSQSSRAQA
jgi:hypothetical protein